MRLVCLPTRTRGSRAGRQSSSGASPLSVNVRSLASQIHRPLVPGSVPAGQFEEVIARDHCVVSARCVPTRETKEAGCVQRSSRIS